MLTSPYKKLTKTAEKKLTRIALVFFLITASAMLYFDAPLKNEHTPLGIVSFEMTRTVDEATTIVNTWKSSEGSKIAAERSLWFDYIFMLAYALLISLILHKVIRYVWKEDTTIHKIGIILMRGVFFAAFLDAVENFGLLKLYYGDMKQHWMSLASSTAMLKFILLIFAILYVLISLLYKGIKK